MIIVPWATLEPTRALVASALPQAPTVAEEVPGALASLWRLLTHRF